MRTSSNQVSQFYVQNILPLKRPKRSMRIEHGYYHFLKFRSITNDKRSTMGQEGYNIRIIHRLSIDKNMIENMWEFLFRPMNSL